MKKNFAGVLPTSHNSNLYPERLDYFNHFINLKCVDFFYGKALEKLQDHEKKVIDNTIDRYWSVIKENTNSLQRDDLKIVALETAWEATEKYITGGEKWNVKGRTKNNPIKINYSKNFSFCTFANEQIKFKFRLVIYKDKINNGAIRLPDSDNVRKIYFNLNKWKNEINLEQKNSLDDNDIEKISKKYNQKFEDIKKIENFQSQVILNGDELITGDSNNNYWDIIEDKEKDTEKNINNEQIFKKYKILQKKFLLQLSRRDRIILLGIKLNEKYTLRELSQKFNISIEAVRKIAEKRFTELQIFMKQYKKFFVNKKTGKLNLM